MGLTLIASDNFNRAALGTTDWAQINSGNGNIQITSSTFITASSAVSAGAAACWIGAGTFTADQRSKLTLAGAYVSLTTDYGIGVIARASADTDAGRDYYELITFDNAGAGGPYLTNLNKMVNGTRTQLATANIAWALTDTIEIETEGSQIRGYRNGTLISGFDITDTALTTGQPGVTGSGGSTTLGGDNWEGYNVSSVPASVALTGTVTASIVESDIVAGGKTIILTVSNDTVVPASAGAITYVGGQVAGFAGKVTVTTVTFALTGGLAAVPAAGDLVICAYAVGSTVDQALTIKNVGGGTDYTLIGSELYADDTIDTNLMVAYRFMPGTPETTLELSGTGALTDAGRYTIHVFRGVDSGTPLDVAAVTATGINTRLANPASITPSTAGAWIYVVGAAGTATGGTYTAGYLTAFLAGTTADTNDAQIGAGYLTWTSGAYDPAAFAAGGTDTTNDSWAAITVALRPLLSTPFADARAAIRDGGDSAQAEAAGYDAKVKPNIPLNNIVRTSATVITITLQAQSDYDITAQETITWTIPATALVLAGAVVATPTFTINLPPVPTTGGYQLNYHR